MNQNSACAMQVAYVNLYLSGYYHRAGKPGQFNAHPGDLYPTMDAAIRDIDPNAPYLGTVQVLVPESLDIGKLNSPTSEPVPLADTREIFRTAGAAGLKEFNRWLTEEGAI